LVWAGFDDEVGVVVGDVAVGFDVVEAEVDGKVVFGVGDDVRALLKECGKAEFEVAVADDFVEDAALWYEIALLFDDEGAGLAEFDVVPDFGAAFVADGELVDLLFEGFDYGSGGFYLGEVAQGVEVFELYRLVEEVSADKFFDFAVENVIAADESEVTLDLSCKVADNAAVIGDRDAVEIGGVFDLVRCDIPEDDCPLFLFEKERVGHFGIAEECRVQFVKVFVFTVDAWSENRNFDVEFIEIFLFVFVVNLNDNGRFRPCSFSHRFSFKGDAFILDGFDKVHEGIGADDAEVFCAVASGEYATQSPAEGLFRENVAFGSVGTQADNSGDVADVPPFFEHQDGDDDFDGTFPTINLIGGFA